MDNPLSEQVDVEHTVAEFYFAEFRKLVTELKSILAHYPEVSLNEPDELRAILSYQQWKCVVAVTQRPLVRLRISAEHVPGMPRKNSIDLVLNISVSGNNWELPGGLGSRSHKPIGKSDVIAKAVVASSKAGIFWLQVIEQNLKID